MINKYLAFIFKINGFEEQATPDLMKAISFLQQFWLETATLPVN